MNEMEKGFAGLTARKLLHVWCDAFNAVLPPGLETCAVTDARESTDPVFLAKTIMEIQHGLYSIEERQTTSEDEAQQPGGVGPIRAGGAM